MLHLCREVERHRAGLRVRERLDVVLRVAGNLDFKVTVLRTFLLHPHAVVAQNYVCINELVALRADRARVGEEGCVSVPFNDRSFKQRIEWYHGGAP